MVESLRVINTVLDVLLDLLLFTFLIELVLFPLEFLDRFFAVLSIFLPTVRCRFLFLITYLKSKSYL